jgi:RES domain-containing protein
MAVLAGRRVFRVCRARYARLDGTRARRVGGRWNSSGRAVVYMAESIALAVLENLVHMTRQDFPRGYVCVAAVLPDGIPRI